MSQLPGSPAALSIKAFCHQIGLGRTNVYARIKKGQIKVLRVGARTLVPAGEVESFLARAAKGEV